jgi:Domain of unknown function (DUF6378)
VTQDTNTTLAERGGRYGPFPTNARIAQDIKNLWRLTPGWKRLSPTQAEALEMIAAKIARILNGDPNYADSWHDIAGFAVLAERELLKPAPSQADFQNIAQAQAPVLPRRLAGQGG